MTADHPDRPGPPDPAPRPVTTRARRRALRRRRAAAGAGVALLTAWAWQPSDPPPRADEVVAGLRVGETVAVPGRPGVTVRVDAVSAVPWCDGRWWRHVGTLTSGPVTAIDVVVAGVDDATEAGRLGAGWRATNALGRPYAGGSACACEDRCEAEPRATADGYASRVLLETGGTLEGVQLEVGGTLLRWDV